MKWFQHTGKQPRFDEVSWSIYLFHNKWFKVHIFLYVRKSYNTRPITLARRWESDEQAARARAYPGNRIASVKPLFSAHPYWYNPMLPASAF